MSSKRLHIFQNELTEQQRIRVNRSFNLNISWKTIETILHLLYTIYLFIKLEFIYLHAIELQKAYILLGNKWLGKKIFKTGACEDTCMVSPCWTGWTGWEPSMKISPSFVYQSISINWFGFIVPCIKLNWDVSREMGSLTMYWRSLDKIGIGNPPADSIAADEPAAVETLRPLDLQCTRGKLDWPSFLIL